MCHELPNFHAMSATDDVDAHDTQHQHHVTREDLYAGPTADDLPDDLRYAPQDDTVCEFCGVSFLVYSEMRTLQDKVDKAEAAMYSWKVR